MGDITTIAEQPKLLHVLENLKDCTRCGLSKTCKAPVPGEGNHTADIMLVGEAPGQYEDVTGQPFVGAAGELLDRLLEWIGLSRDEVYITNMVKCRPPGNRDPANDEIATCAPKWLVAEILAVRPKVVVTLGLTATRFFTHVKKLADVARIPFHSSVDGPDGEWGFTVFPTYHPAVGMHNPKMANDVWLGFRALKKFLDFGHTVDLVGKPDYWSFCLLDHQIKTPLTEGHIGMDTENTPDGKIYCVTMSSMEGQGIAFYPYCSEERETLLAIQDFLKYNTPIFHNALHDLMMLKQLGIEVPQFEDTMVMAYVLQEPSLSLKSLARERLGMEMQDFEDVAPAKDISLADEGGMEYACRDADATRRLYFNLKQELEDKGLWEVYETDRDCLHLALQMMSNGVLIDKEHFAKLETNLTAKMDDALYECHATAGFKFNPASTQQTSHALFERLNLPQGKKTKTGYSTAKSVLDKLEDKYPVVRHIIEFRRLKKLLSTYIIPLPKMAGPDGRIHGVIKPTSTETGRWSAENPNLQNQPVRDEEGREVRNGFVASPGYSWVSIDMSMIELRTLAHTSRCPGLIRPFLTKGTDVHAQTASEIQEVPLSEVSESQRRDAKTANFAIPYKVSPTGLLVQVNSSISSENKKRPSDQQESLRSLEWAESFIDTWFGRRPGVRTYMKRVEEDARKRGYVKSLSGRRRWVFDIYSPKEAIKSAAVRKIVNMPIQELASWIIKKVMAHPDIVDSKYDVRALLQIHDSLEFEVRKGQEYDFVKTVVHVMQTAYPLIVPIEAESKMGDRWGSLKVMEM